MTLMERVQQIVEHIECKPYQFEVEALRSNAVVLYAKLWRQDTHSLEWGWGYSGPYLIEEVMSDDVIAKRTFVAARDFAEHEVREAWKYKGKRLLSPHISLDKLWEIE